MAKKQGVVFRRPTLSLPAPTGINDHEVPRLETSELVVNILVGLESARQGELPEADARSQIFDQSEALFDDVLPPRR